MSESKIQILIAGSGVMGRGIARTFDDAGMTTGILSRNPGAVTGIAESIEVVADLPPEPPELIIESVPEFLELKDELYQRIEAHYEGAPILASNTSGLPLQRLAEPLKFPERFCGIHYFQPADVTPMAEVARVAETEAVVITRACDLLKATGKMVVVLNEPVPGLLINRLQHAILNEAYRLIEDGITTAVDVDRAAKYLLGPRMCVTGLIEQKDLSGLDTHALAQAAIVPYLYHDDAPSPVVTDKYAENKLGIKTGTGFYDWRQMDVPAYRAWAASLLDQLLATIDAARRDPPPLAEPNGE